MSNDILKKHNFTFTKKFGQNFIFDTNLLKSIVSDAQIASDDCVLEIGTGAGTLTKEIANVAWRVITYEIDTELKDVLDETFANYKNIELHFADIMKVDTNTLEQEIGRKYKVVANLPYYITTPILFKFLEEAKNVTSLTVMVQKEVGERMCAKHNTLSYGTLSVAIATRGDCKITRIVKKNMFTPMPNVDSCIVKIELYNKFDIVDRNTLDKLIRVAFAMRRKTLYNNLVAGFGIEKEKAKEYLKQANLDEKIRGEAIDEATFVKLSNIIASNN